MLTTRAGSLTIDGSSQTHWTVVGTSMVPKTVTGGAAERAHLAFESEVIRRREKERELGKAGVRRNLLRANSAVADAAPSGDTRSTQLVDSLDVANE